MTTEEKFKHILGKAVHPEAIKRLAEIAPDARVAVRHFAEDSQLGYRRLDYNNPNVTRGTRVIIWHEGEDSLAVGESRVHPKDNFDRKKGIELAFRRALKQVPRPAPVLA